MNYSINRETHDKFCVLLNGINWFDYKFVDYFPGLTVQIYPNGGGEMMYYSWNFRTKSWEAAYG